MPCHAVPSHALVALYMHASHQQEALFPNPLEARGNWTPSLPGCFGHSLPEVTCSQTMSIDTRFFATPLAGCAWDQDIDGCGRPLDWCRLRRKRFYFLGNSVTRHYSHALASIVHNQRDQTSITRQQEKKLQSAGKKWISTSDPVVYSFWKNGIGLGDEYDDRDRDVCASTSTRNCLLSLFRGSSENDVLIIGSLPHNTTLNAAVNGSTREWRRQNVLAFRQTRVYSEIVEMLLEVFPGAIIWHSYAFWVMGRDKEALGPMARHESDLNICNRFSTAKMRCAIIKHGTGRMQYFNMWPHLSKHWPQYADQIHHPGPLTEAAVFAMLSALKPYVNLSVGMRDAQSAPCSQRPSQSGSKDAQGRIVNAQYISKKKTDRRGAAAKHTPAKHHDESWLAKVRTLGSLRKALG